MDMGKRAYGALLGVAFGDALGMPSQLWSRRKVKAYFGEITGFLPGPPGHFVAGGMQAGQVTDDTIQTIKVAEAILADDGCVRAETVAAKLLELVTESNVLETNMFGPSSKQALASIKDGVPITESGKTVLPMGRQCGLYGGDCQPDQQFDGAGGQRGTGVPSDT